MVHPLRPLACRLATQLWRRARLPGRVPPRPAPGGPRQLVSWAGQGDAVCAVWDGANGRGNLFGVWDDVLYAQLLLHGRGCEWAGECNMHTCEYVGRILCASVMTLMTMLGAAAR